jgi:hypothetical protein
MPIHSSVSVLWTKLPIIILFVITLVIAISALIASGGMLDRPYANDARILRKFL